MGSNTLQSVRTFSEGRRKPCEVFLGCGTTHEKTPTVKHQIDDATLAVMRQFDAAGIFEAYIQTATGDYRLHFDHDLGSSRWLLDISDIVNAEDAA